MHVGEDESFYRPVNISDNDWRDIVYFQQADGVMLVGSYKIFRTCTAPRP